VTTALRALRTMTAKMRTTMMATALLAIKVLGLITALGPIRVMRLMTMGTTMTMRAAVVIKGVKQSL
jgi:hypothetical protein